MLSNCGIDEYGNIAGGQAGDQTGKEYAIISWYYGNWTYVFRHPNQRVRNLIARLAIQAALNNLIGYDQSQRLTFWYRLIEAGYDPSKINKACEADCSSSTAAILKAVGILLGISGLANIYEGMSTWVEVETLRAAGFQVLTASKYLTSERYLEPGDVLLKYGHTAIYVGSGRLADFPMEVDMLDNNDINNIWGHDNAGAKLTATNDNVAGISGKLDSVLARLNYSTPISPFGGTMYRLISTAKGGAHRWTNSASERDALIGLGWTLENDNAFTLGKAGEPVWALINPYTDDTILTANMAEAEGLAKAGWRSLGIIGTTGEGKEVHRLVNKANNFHMFTTDPNEVNVLHSSGWSDEEGGFKAA